METRFVDITPSLAQKWLAENNKHNRPIYDKTVESYARDMKRGLWNVTNQGIGFDINGVLIDGQQRLTAIVWSGTTQRMLVVRGLPIDAQSTVDTGKPRSVGDILCLSFGLDNANLRVAVVRSIIGIINPSNPKLSANSIKSIMDLYSTEIDLVIEHKKAVRGLIYAPTLGAFAFAAHDYQKEAIEFEDKYFSGEGLLYGNPILTFRNYMLNRTYVGGGGHVARKEAHNAALTSLMYYILQKPLKRIINNLSGAEFFLIKQRKTVNQVIDLMKF